MSALASAIISAAVAVLTALFNAIGNAWRGQRAQAGADDARRREGAMEAGNETQQVIAETADERAALAPAPDDPDDLARSLRARKSDGAAGRHG